MIQAKEFVSCFLFAENILEKENGFGLDLFADRT